MAEEAGDIALEHSEAGDSHAEIQSIINIARCKAKLRELQALLHGHNWPPYFHVVLKAGNVLFLLSFKP